MIPETTIKISGTDYKVKRNWKSLILFEEVAKKNIDQMKGSATDLLILFYCIVKANNKGFIYSYNEFIDMIDEDENCVDEFTGYILKLAQNEQVEEDKKKV